MRPTVYAGLGAGSLRAQPVARSPIWVGAASPARRPPHGAVFTAHPRDRSRLWGTAQFCGNRSAASEIAADPRNASCLFTGTRCAIRHRAPRWPPARSIHAQQRRRGYDRNRGDQDQLRVWLDDNDNSVSFSEGIANANPSATRRGVFCFRVGIWPDDADPSVCTGRRMYIS